ncbi:MAG TPA: hypothetical protein VEB21_13290, partial [Terriglobales bacterium]|nr:hypothetical protein [Terriglobales bacterium]
MDTQSENSVTALSDEIRSAFGTDLLSLALFGSAAGDDFVPGESDINLAIVLKTVGLLQLDIFQRELPRWRKRGAATPILLDPDYLEHAADVFPMELQDIQARHRVLHGTDVFSSVRIDPQHLRFQLEQEARSKLLRLRLAYIEGDGSDEQLEALMLQSVKAFVSIARSLNRWREPSLCVGDA